LSYAYIDADGNRIETNSVGNATWQAVLPQNKKGWYCLQCGIFMKAYPISHDLPFSHYSCSTCKKNITVTERNEVFDTTVKLAKEKCDLKTLEYNKDDRSWKIESSLFIGDSRIGARRKPIGPTERQEIIGKVQEVLQEELHISFENFQEFFSTE
jgi:hypothetical protein